MRTVTATTTLLATDDVVLCNPSANTVLTLPAASSGHMITIKRINTSATTCNVAGIWATDGANPFVLTAPTTNAINADENAITVMSDATNWYILGRH